MLTRTCPRCDGKRVEPSTDKGEPCLGCKGCGTVAVSDEPISFTHSDSGVMKIDPSSDPKRKEARKLSLKTCGVCQCCRRWKAKNGLAGERRRMAIANAQKWASYWKQQYEVLNAAKGRDHQSEH